MGPADGPNASGWGPLRVWPGGLCLSRSLGDFDVGTCVLALPHITQARSLHPPASPGDEPVSFIHRRVKDMLL